MAELSAIRRVAEQKRISLKEIADGIGMSADGLQKILRKGDTSLSTLEKIAEVLGVAVGSLFGDDAFVTQTNRSGDNITARNVQKGESLEPDMLEVIREKDRQIEKLLRIIETLTNR
jgi:transcriptional regulator with XRE-family HTH domain